MIHRQLPNQLVHTRFQRIPVKRPKLAHIRHHILVRNHHTFASSGGSRGVAEESNPFGGLAGLEREFGERGDFFACGEELVYGGQVEGLGFVVGIKDDDGGGGDADLFRGFEGDGEDGGVGDEANRRK